MLDRERSPALSSSAFAAAIESMDESFAIYDLEGRYVFVNAATERLLGRPRGELLGRSFWDVFPASLGTPFHRAYLRVVETSRAERFDHFYEPWQRWFENHVFRSSAEHVTIVSREITERKRADALAEALTQSRQEEDAQRALLHALFEQAPIALAVWRGPEHVFEFASPNYLRLFGRSDVVGKRVREVYPEPELSQRGLWELWDRVYSSGEPFSAAEYEVMWDRTGTGQREQGFFAFSLSPIRERDGSVGGLVAIAVEITAQVRARQKVEELAAALNESEARHRHIFETAGVSLWEVDLRAVLELLDAERSKLAGAWTTHFLARPELVDEAIGRARIVNVNGESVRALGARDKTELMHRFAEVFLPETRAFFLEELAALASEQKEFSGETAMRSLRGERLEVMCTIRFPDSRAAFERVPIALTDITARKHQERALEFLSRSGNLLAGSRDVQNTLTSLVRLAVPAIADCAIVYLHDASRGSTELAALAHVDPAKESLVREAYRFASQSDPRRGFPRVIRDRTSELVPEITSAFRDSVAIHTEHRRVLEELGACSYLTVPILLHEKALGAISLVTTQSGRRLDTTDLAMAEELARRVAIALDYAQTYERAQSDRERAERANRSKDLFLSTLSHELRTPLNAILGWTRLLRDGRLPAEQRERAIEVIDRNARTQVALVDDVLDVSRIVSGKLHLNITPVQLDDVIAAALDTVRQAAEAKEIEVRVELDADAAAIYGDSARLQQVVWNLLANALKFTPRGGAVDVRLRKHESNAEISVSDTGKGIDPALLTEVFEMFRQEDATSTRQHGGLGLGLAIVKHIVELHGGTVHAESDGAGHGSRFVVRLPATHARADERHLVRTLERRPGLELECPANLVGLDILLVDDEADAREMLALVFERCGARTVLAASVDEALLHLREQPFGAVVSDIGMPGRDGYELIRSLRAMPHPNARTAAVALTAFASPMDRTRALLAGFDAHVTKPVEPQELLVVLARVVVDRSEASGVRGRGEGP